MSLQKTTSIVINIGDQRCSARVGEGKFLASSTISEALISPLLDEYPNTISLCNFESLIPSAVRHPLDCPSKEIDTTTSLRTHTSN